MTRTRIPATRPALPVLLLIPLFLGCGDDGDPTWTMVRSDEFEGPAGQLSSAANWAFDIGTDWGNRQLEYDTGRPENVSLDQRQPVKSARKSLCPLAHWLAGL